MATETTQTPAFIISSHNRELDYKIGGGVPVGSLTLIEGSSGAGKSVFAQQILWGALQDGFTATLFTSENSISSLVSQMKKLDLDILDFLLLGHCYVYTMALSNVGALAPAALLSAISEQRHQNIVIIDSVTNALLHANQKTALHFFEECKRFCADDLSIILTLHADVIGEDKLSPIRSICDVDLRLRTDQTGQRVIKTLEVSKVRGADSVTGAIVGFEVEPGWGLRVIPISKVRG